MKAVLDTDIVDIESKKGGIAYYTSFLAQELVQQSDEVDLLHYEPSNNPMYDDSELLFELPKWQWMPQRASRRAFRRAFTNATRVRSHLNKTDVDVVHLPFKDPFTAPLFYSRSYGTVLTVHDLIHFRSDHSFDSEGVSGYLRRSAWNLLQRNFLRTVKYDVDRFIVGTETVKANLNRFLSVPTSKISVIPYGIPSVFAPREDPDLGDGVAEPYILSNVSPHPEAFTIFRDLKRRGVPHDLVLFGRESHLDAHRELIDDLGIGPDVVFTGYVTTDRLASLYSGADVYFGWEKGTYGIGLPNLEAMACGTPVVTTNDGATPEGVGDAALMAAPDDLEVLTDALHDLIDDRDLHATMAERALSRAGEFSYERAAKETLEVYHSVTDERPT